jgi:diguanylate cyclase (GGDEF)-like protein
MSLPDTLEHRTEQPTPPKGRKQAMLLVVQGSEADLGAHARVERSVIIGRDPAAELSLTDAGASKHHAAVEAVEGFMSRVHYEIRDLGSTNGTRVNGKLVKRTRKLKDGDKISLAGTVVRFSLADEVDAAFHDQVEALLSTDALTGLLAPRKFDAALEETFRAAKAKDAKLALLVLDLDNLKAINDTHGHALGAFTIAEVGRLLADTIGARGVSTRFGGDEFAAYLPDCDAAAAREIAEEVRARIQAHRFVQKKIVLHPTLSIGVAALAKTTKTVKAFFDLADRALYRAKAGGKDRVEQG